MLFLSQLKRQLDPINPFDQIAPYSAISESGEHISEWSVPLGSLEQFVSGA